MTKMTIKPETAQDSLTVHIVCDRGGQERDLTFFLKGTDVLSFEFDEYMGEWTTDSTDEVSLFELFHWLKGQHRHTQAAATPTHCPKAEREEDA